MNQLRWCTLFVLFLALSCSPSHAQVQDKPNIVFILADDMREDDLDGMPLTNSLLKGADFNNYYATYPLCCPSRATILTGLYAHNHHVDSNIDGWQKFRSEGHERASLAPTLDTAGYRTGMFGRYLTHYDDPTKVPRGWDEWASLVYDAKDKGGQYYGYDLSENGVSVRYGSAEADYATDVIANKTEEFIRGSAGAPFFTFVGLTAPHTPLTPAERHRNLLGDLRAETLLAVDEAVENIVDTLDETGELDNTYIFFTSDNGWMEGEHGLYKKQYPYEESASVPLLIRGPGVTPGVEVDSLVGNTDLAPTFVELAGTTIPADGRSLVPLFDGTEAEWRKRLLIENPTDSRGPYGAIRTDTHKLIDWRDGQTQDELFNLVIDPNENQNLLLDLPTVDRTLTRTLREDLSSLEGCSGESCRAAEDS